MAESNKHDGVFTGGTQTITRPDPASIPPNDPRPEEGAPVGTHGSDSLGAGWSGTPKVPQPKGTVPSDLDTNRPLPEDVPLTPVTNPAWREV